MKIYQDLTEALKDIDWQGKGHRSPFEVVHNKNHRGIREREVVNFFSQEFGPWIMKSRLEQVRGKEYMGNVARILWELIKNAEYESKQGQSFIGEIYVGNKGCLLGTVQQARFLDDSEIELLTRYQEPVNSTKPGDHQGGSGTRIILEECKGILILKRKKSIYVSI